MLPNKLNKNLAPKISFLVLLLFITPITTAAPVVTAADELIDILNNSHSIQASFEQYLTNNQGKIIGEKATGSMALKRPGKFRWDVSYPNKQLIIINNNQSLLYDADLEQVVKHKMDYNNPSNPAMLLSSSTKSLANSFNIVKLKKPGSGLWFKLTPKAKSSQEVAYRWIAIHFVAGQLTTMHIVDSLEQKTVINFSNILFNPQISPKTFVFNPPPKTEIFNN